MFGKNAKELKRICEIPGRFVCALIVGLSLAATESSHAADPLSPPKAEILSILVENAPVTNVRAIVAETTVLSPSVRYGTSPYFLEISFQTEGYCWGDFVERRTQSPDKIGYSQVSKVGGGPSAACAYDLSTRWLPERFELIGGRWIDMFVRDIPQVRELTIGTTVVSATFTLKEIDFGGARSLGLEITDVIVK